MKSSKMMIFKRNMKFAYFEKSVKITTSISQKISKKIRQNYTFHFTKNKSKKSVKITRQIILV